MSSMHDVVFQTLMMPSPEADVMLFWCIIAAGKGEARFYAQAAKQDCKMASGSRASLMPSFREM
jgi:hypothetical protein